MTDLQAELQDELTRLRIVTVRRLRERLDDPKEPATPAYLDVARKILSDFMAPPPPVARAPAISRALPFPGEVDDP